MLIRQEEEEEEEGRPMEACCGENSKDLLQEERSLEAYQGVLWSQEAFAGQKPPQEAFEEEDEGEEGEEVPDAGRWKKQNSIGAEAEAQAEAGQELCAALSADAYGDENSGFGVKVFVIGAGARILFYPTLLYNIVRNTLEPDFRWWDQIEEFLLLGAVPFPKHVLCLKDLGVEAVVTLNEPYETLVSPSLYERQMMKHLVIPTRDYYFAPSFSDIQRATDFIHGNVEQRKATYVHCKAGRGRSTTIVLCYLVRYRGMTPLAALHYVRSKRPRILLADSQWKAVLKYSELQQSQKAAIMAPALTVLHHIPKNKNFQHGNNVSASRPMHHCYERYCCDDESPVLVTLLDLEGYKEVEGDGYLMERDELHGNIGLVCKMGAMTAKSVIGMAKASVALARLSYIWLGYQRQNQAVFSGDQASFSITSACNNLSPSVLGPDVPLSHQRVPICQQGLVEC